MGFIGCMFSFPALFGALIVAGIVFAVIVIQHNKNNVETAAAVYLDEGSFKVEKKDEVFVKSYETREKVASSDSSKK